MGTCCIVLCRLAACAQNARTVSVCQLFGVVLGGNTDGGNKIIFYGWNLIILFPPSLRYPHKYLAFFI